MRSLGRRPLKCAYPTRRWLASARQRAALTGRRLNTATAKGREGGEHQIPQQTRPEMSDPTDSYTVTADELRQFIERFEQLEAEKKDVAEQQKELMAEAKGRGYDTKVLRKVVALRKRKPDDIAEEEAVLELYKTALGMA